MYIDTHESIVSKLPDVEMGVSMPSPNPDTKTARGFGGVAMLYKMELHDRMHVVHKDIDALHM